MSRSTLPAADPVGEAVARYESWTTDDLNLHVGTGAYCIADPAEPRESRLAWEEQWLAPPATHPNIPDHVWRDRVEILARHLCGPCPVREACLALSERNRATDDGWIAGGLAPHQRHPATVTEAVASCA